MIAWFRHVDLRPGAGLWVLRVALLVFVTLLLTIGSAFADGIISGSVKNGASQAIAGTKVFFFNVDNDEFFETLVDPTTGNYSVSVPDGSYAVLTNNNQGYINEIWNDVQCSAVCDIDAIDPLAVTTGANFANIDFVLNPGGRISGTITDAVTHLPIAGVVVRFFEPSGEVDFTQAVTDANGHYISDAGTATGNVFLKTENGLGYQNEVWNNVKCFWCDETQVGTPLPVTNGVTTSGIDFALDPGGRIAGTVTNGVSPLPDVTIIIHTTNGTWFMYATTDGAGQYVTDGLPAGSYYVTTFAPGRVDEIYNNVPCIGGTCAMTGGTAVAVTVGTTTNNIDFALAAGGTISGTVTQSGSGTPLQTFVSVFNSSGGFIGGAQPNGEGQYEAVVPAGSYYVSIQNASYAGQVYNGVACAATNCNVLLGSLVAVSVGAAVNNINFSLVAGGSITGRVTAAADASAVPSYALQVVSSTGVVLGTAFTDSAGNYTFSGLAAGSYYVRTSGAGFNLINQLYNGIQCIGCNVTTTAGGTLVAVTVGNTTNNINFALQAGGRISGTIRNAANNNPIPNVGAQIFTSAGVQLSTHNTNASGVYTTSGLPPGTYYIRTSNSLGFVNEVYDNLACPQTGCIVTNGAPITVTLNTVTTGIDFGLAAGGIISGTVTNAAGGAALSNLNVQIYNSVGTPIGSVNTNGAGQFATSGLPAGTYYLRTNNSGGFVDELYNDIVCTSTAVCNVTAGTPIVVTAGATASGKNFALAMGGAISGTVKDANTLAGISGVSVSAYASNGSFVKPGSASAANGTYTVSGLPAGTYYIRTSIAGGFIYYLDELYSELPCSPTCTVTTGTSIVVTAGATQSGKDFTLTAGGGAVSGTVRDAQTLAGLSGITVQIYNGSGTVVKSSTTSASGAYTISGLPAGTYYARTIGGPGNYINQLFEGLSCATTCTVTSGTPIVVTDNNNTGGRDFALTANLVQNGTFAAGTAGWKTFGAPNDTYMTWNTDNGSFNFRRAPQPGGTPVSQGLLFQDTGIAVPTNTAVTAQFSLASTASKVMVMRVLLVGDSANFGLDFAACTFALPGDGIFRTYRMQAHSTQAWPNAAVYFYATQLDAVGGNFYKVDNVSVAVAPGGSLQRTECIDPLAPGTTAGADSANLLVNSDFTAGMANWGEDGAIVRRNPMVGGVYEFYRTAAFRPPVVLQQANPTLQAGGMLPANQRMTLTLDLGNSLPARARALVLVNDNDFSSFVACAFWLGPNQPLSTYAMQFYTSEPWQNPAVSIYPSTGAVSPGWLRLDNVVLQKTPSAATTGSVCLEGSEASALMALNGFGGGAFGTLMAAVAPPADEADAPSRPGDDGSPSSAGGLAGAGASSPLDEPLGSPDGTWTKDGDEWTTTARGDAETPHVLRWLAPIDLAATPEAHLTFESQLSATDSQAEVQVSLDDGHTWMTIALLGQADTWDTVDVDLSAFHGSVIHVRFAFEGVSSAAEAEDRWRLRDVTIGTASELARTATRETRRSAIGLTRTQIARSALRLSGLAASGQ